MIWIWKTVGVSAKSNPLLLNQFFPVCFSRSNYLFRHCIQFLEPEFRYDCICDFFFLNVTVHLLYPHLMHLIIMYVV